MAELYVSYAAEDVFDARMLAYALERAGFAVWLHEGEPEGDYYSRQERDAAKCVLVLWSRRSVHADPVCNDAWIAFTKGTLVQVLRQRANPPAPLNSPLVDLSGWQGELHHAAFLELVFLIQHQIALWAVRASTSDPPTLDATQAPTLPTPLPPSSDHESIPTPPEATTKASTGPAVFLCYRRNDTQDAAGRLYDRLATAYGPDRVFMDIDSVPVGVDFVQHVASQIALCSVVIVMIGKQWLKTKDRRRRRRRLDNEDDTVRLEIAAALRQQIPVIPVLLQDVHMPHSDELPEDIRPLVRRNGVPLSATRWRSDVDRLIKELDRVLGT